MTDPDDLCSKFGLSGLELSICKSMEKAPLTANLVYKLFSRIEPKLPVLADGIKDIVQGGVVKIIIQYSLLQQIPWLIGYILIALVLISTQVITTSIFILLILIAFGVAAAITVLNLYTIKQQSKDIIQKVESRLNSNVAEFKKGLSL